MSISNQLSHSSDSSWPKPPMPFVVPMATNYKDHCTSLLLLTEWHTLILHRQSTRLVPLGAIRYCCPSFFRNLIIGPSSITVDGTTLSLTYEDSQCQMLWKVRCCGHPFHTILYKMLLFRQYRDFLVFGFWILGITIRHVLIWYRYVFGLWNHLRQ